MLKSFILPKKRGNHSTTAKRAEDGRKGRGEDAFSAKSTAEFQACNQRVEAIAKRNQVNGEDGSAARVSGPIFARHLWLRAKKF
jgi:hypothetical protein